MRKSKEEKPDNSDPQKKNKKQDHSPLEKDSRDLIDEALKASIVHEAELEVRNDQLLDAQSKLTLTIDEYTQLFDRAPVGYFILSKEGKIVNANDTACKQLGFQKKEIFGKSLSFFLNSKKLQETFDRHRIDVIKTEKTRQLECEIRGKDGSLFFALIESTVVKDNTNHFKHLLSTVSDITERKTHEHMLEQALFREKELNQMKSQFVSIASHEFRTPLATILTSAELMEKYNSPGDEEVKKKHLQKITNAVSRVKEILIDFLSVEEVEKGSLRNNPLTFDIVEFTENVLQEVKSFNGTHYINYQHIGKFRNVFLDPKLLKTSLSNLLINAYKYSPDGGTIEIRTEQKKVGNLLITVKDNGIGIPKNEIYRVFEQFFRAKNAEKIQGTGIGLHIVKKLVTIMGGTISFESEEQKGSTFYVKF